MAKTLMFRLQGGAVIARGVVTANRCRRAIVEKAKKSLAKASGIRIIRAHRWSSPGPAANAGVAQG
jgi:hypothetical protein